LIKTNNEHSPAGYTTRMSQRDSFLSKNNKTTNKSLELIQKNIINVDNINSYSNDNRNSSNDDNDHSQSSSLLVSLPITPNPINKIITNQLNHNNLSTPLSASTSSSTTSKSKIHTSGYANSISTIISHTNNSFSTLRYYIPETVSTDRIFTLERILGYTGGPAVILYESKY